MGGKSSTQTTSNEPPKWAKPLFVKSAGVAEDLFDSGSGFNVYDGQTIADHSAGTQAGLEGLLGVGSDPSLQNLSAGAIQGNTDLINSGGYNDQTAQAAGIFGDAGTGGLNTSLGYYQNAPNTNQAVQGATNTYGQAAGGQMGTSGAGIAGVNSFNPLQQGAAGVMGLGALGGLNSQAGQGYAGMFGTTGQPLSSERNLQSFADGSRMGENTYENEHIKTQARDLADQVAMQYSGAGRYGSGLHQDTLVDSVGDFQNKAYGDQFNRERGMQFDANRMLDAAQGQRFGQGLSSLQGLLSSDMQNAGLQMGAAGQLGSLGGQVYGQQMGQQQALTGLDQANRQLQLQGAQGLLGAGQSVLDNQFRQAGALTGTESGNMDRQLAGATALQGAGQSALDTQLQGFNALPSTMQSSLFAPTANMQAGAIQDQYDQSQLNDQIRQFYENDMQDWTRLGALQAAAGGAAGPYGTSTTTSKQPFNPMSMLGGLMSFI
jgi:hypothetical protein